MKAAGCATAIIAVKEVNFLNIERFCIYLSLLNRISSYRPCVMPDGAGGVTRPNFKFVTPGARRAMSIIKSDSQNRVDRFSEKSELWEIFSSMLSA
jgi:hypothetical protein